MQERCFCHSYSHAGLRAKITIEWSAPDGTAEDKLTMASDVADEVLATVWKKTHDIVEAME